MSYFETASDKAAEFVREALAFIHGGDDPATAVASAKAATGVTESDLQQADTGDLLQLLCGTPGYAPWGTYFDAVQNSYNGNGNVVVQGGGNSSGGSSYSGGGSSYSGGGSSYSGGGSSVHYAPSPAEQIVYNYNSYEQTINDQDNIFSGIFEGDIAVDQSQTDIEGDGNVVTHGEGDTNAATGEGSSAAQSDEGDATSNSGDEALQNTGTNFGQQNTGDGAVQAGDDITAPVNTGFNSGIIADGDVEDVVLGDGNTTVQDSDDVVLGDGNDVVQDSEDVVQGDGNQTVQDSDGDGSVFNFGDGDVNNASNNDVEDGAVAAGGDATNVSDNTLDDGSALSANGDAFGFNDESDDHSTDVDVNIHDNETNVVDANHSIVQTEQGPGDAHQEVEIEEPHHPSHPTQVEDLALG